MILKNKVNLAEKTLNMKCMLVNFNIDTEKKLCFSHEMT